MWILCFFGALFLFACICDVDNKVRELNRQKQWLQSQVFELKKRIERLEEMVGDDK